MNIVIITEYFPESSRGEITGGVESRAFNIAKGLSKDHNVIVVTGRTENSGENETFSNIKIIRPVKHRYSHSTSFFSRLRFAFKAYKTAKKLDADIIDGYNFISYLPAYFAARKAGAKAVATYHETWLGEWIKNKGWVTGIFGSLWERLALKLKWDKIISVSDFTKKKLVKLGIPEKTIDVVPNGADISQYSRIKVNKKRNLTICCVSRLVKTKRVDDLIRSLAIIRKEFPSVRCEIVGDGGEKDNLKTLAMEKGVNDNVDFRGFVKSHTDVVKTIKSSHILCHPSILEGFGMVLVEAMACGVPYVCSDIPPLVEVTEHGRGGLIFKKKNPKDLAKQVIRLFNDKELYKKKKNEGKLLSGKYEWKKIVQMTKRAYENLAENEK